MTEDHTFVDSGGRVDSGRSSMTKGWSEYFRMFPDYQVKVECMLEDGNLEAAPKAAESSMTMSNKANRGLRKLNHAA